MSPMCQTGDRRSLEYLNLGCGDKWMRDLSKGVRWTNVDIVKPSGMPDDVPFETHDLRYPLPFADGRFDHILLDNVLEHLRSRDAIQLLNEMDRVLKIGGTALIIVPHALSQGAYQDPTHVSFWVPRSAIYWNQFSSPYGGRRVGITANFRTENIEIDGDMSTECFIKFHLMKVRD